MLTFPRARSRLSLVGVLFALNDLAAVADAATLQRFSLPKSKYPKALCLDGTSPYIYVLPGSGANKNRWIVYLQGGGSCTNEHECLLRSRSSLGSSSEWPLVEEEIQLVTSPRSSVVSDHVPDFAGFSQAKLRYCDGQLHSSMKSPGNSTTWDLNFGGRWIFEAAMQELIENHGLDKGELFILTGTSAGGAGTFYNGLFAKRFLESHSQVQNPNFVTNQPIRTLIIPEGIWIHYSSFSDILFPAYLNQPWGQDLVTQISDGSASQMVDIVEAARNEQCMLEHANNRSYCSDAQNYMKYLVGEVPTFIVWNRWDTHSSTVGPVLNFEDQAESKSTLKAWGDFYQQFILDIVQKGDYGVGNNKTNVGIFHPSCMGHARTPRNTKMLSSIDSLEKTKGEVIGAWYRKQLFQFGLPGGVDEVPASYQLTHDEWGSQMKCNPSCCDTKCQQYSNGCGDATNPPIDPNAGCPSKDVLAPQLSQIRNQCQKFMSGSEENKEKLCGDEMCMSAYLNSALTFKVDDDTGDQIETCSLEEALEIMEISGVAQITWSRNLIARLRACGEQDPELLTDAEKSSSSTSTSRSSISRTSTSMSLQVEAGIARINSAGSSLVVVSCFVCLFSTHIWLAAAK